MLPTRTLPETSGNKWQQVTGLLPLHLVPTSPNEHGTSDASDWVVSERSP